MSTDIFLEGAVVKRMENRGEMGWLAGLLQATDTAYPVGGFAHSGGLEGLVQLGEVVDEAGLDLFMGGVLRHGISHVELPLLGHAWEAATAGDFEALAALDRLSMAVRPAAELREAARRTGAQRLGMVEVVGEVDALFLLDVREALANTQVPVVAGVEAVVMGVPKEAAMGAFGYGVCAGVTSACLKLLRMGQSALQRRLGECGRRVPAMVEAALEVGVEDIGSFAPAWDIGAMRHERAERRLFLS